MQIRSDRLPDPHSAIKLLRFFMRLVASTVIAELLELKPIRRLLLVLSRNVITMLTFSTLKSDVISWHNPSTAKLKVYQQIREFAYSQKLKALERAREKVV